MLTVVGLIFIVALIAPWIYRVLQDKAGWVLALVPFSSFLYLASFFPEIAAGGSITQSVTWVSMDLFEVNLAFYLDGLSLMFGLIITGIGTFIVLYGSGYLANHAYLPRFFTAVLLFMGSMLGVVLADNLISIFVFWELTSFTSYLLIGFNHEQESSRKAALQALLVTGIGGLALLGGMVLMGFASGAWEVSTLLNEGDIIREHPHYLAILLLVLGGAFTKSAQFPFHFWLPGAMAAPTPVSAYLHSATMVKAGVYLLARFHPVLGFTDTWMMLVGGFGVVTLLISAWLSLSFTDLKQILAYSTVMALGTMMMLIGLGTELAMQGLAVYVLSHAMYKGALFMVAGGIDHEAGTRDVLKLGGLRSLMPISAIAAMIAALSMAGIPPLFGFIAKELVYEAALGANFWAVGFITLAVLANIAIVSASLIVAIRPFYGPKTETPKKAHEAPFLMWIGPLTLAVLSALFGLLPFIVDSKLMVPVASAVWGSELDFYLSLWHGINLPLILSVVTAAAGVGVYFIWDSIRESAPMKVYQMIFARFPVQVYESLVNGMLNLAGFQTRVLQNGLMSNYLITIMVAAIAAVGYTFFTKSGVIFNPDVSEVQIHEWAIAFGIVISLGVMLFFTHSRLTMVVAAGIIGFGLALIYLMHGAADLAMTQVLVETLTVILVVLVLIHIPKMKESRSILYNSRDAIVAIAMGTLMTLLIFAVTAVPFDAFISEFYADASYPLAHGRNIVNVILVDFRALDTMGEVVVVAIAGLAVYALIKMTRAGAEKDVKK
ncbi:putative monovalent cation/H+ antiporter subunit A [Balneolaceae bacterium ANBcel3]|nr:putative monovalent cation/H+ antiporter subunit A [Balneolaceae bacterium ANBcel3]